MKATFFSVAALVAGAIASPVANGPVDATTQELQILQELNKVSARASDPAGDALHIVDDDLVDELGLGQVVDASTQGSKVSTRETAPIWSVDELASKLQSTVSDVTSHTKDVKSILSKVQSGDMSKKAGVAQVTKEFSLMHFKLSDLVNELTAAAGLPVAKGDTDKVLTLLTNLLNELLSTVKSVVTILGAAPQLTSILHSVFNLVAELLTLVTGLVTSIVPGLVTALTPLLSGLGNGLLDPILGGVAALLKALTGSA